MPLVPSLSPGGETPRAEIDARRTGAEAFAFGFPLLLSTTTMRWATKAPDGGQAPVNRFAHLDGFPDPSLRAIVAGNANTLYSLAWLDLASEPIVLRVPDTEGRSYLVSLTSAWTETIACLSPRTAAAAGGFALVGPSWEGDSLPDGLQRVDAPTNAVLITGHIHARGPDDLSGSPTDTGSAGERPVQVATPTGADGRATSRLGPVPTGRVSGERGDTAVGDGERCPSTNRANGAGAAVNKRGNRQGPTGQRPDAGHGPGAPGRGSACGPNWYLVRGVDALPRRQQLLFRRSIYW